MAAREQQRKTWRHTCYMYILVWIVDTRQQQIKIWRDIWSVSMCFPAEYKNLCSVRKFDSFMNFTSVLCKLTLTGELFATLSARIFDSFMNCPSVFCKITLIYKSFATKPASTLDSFMNCHSVFCWAWLYDFRPFKERLLGGQIISKMSSFQIILNLGMRGGVIRIKYFKNSD